MAPSGDKNDKRDPALSWDVPPGLDGAEDTAAASRAAFSTIAASHLRSLTSQLLAAEGVDDAAAWAPVLARVAQAAADALSPVALTAAGDIDPRRYIQIKRLVACGGTPADSNVVAGVACRKNVAHKRMRTSVAQPRVVLLGGALEYSRVAAGSAGSKLSSFEQLMEQERA